MYIDKFLEFDPAASAITVTRDSTNIIDLGAQADFGPGSTLWVNVFVQTTLTAAGAATLTVAVQGAPNAAGVPGAFVTYIQTPALAVADLVAGVVQCIQLPPKPVGVAKITFPRFLKLVYTVATGPFTAGTLRADLTQAPSNEGVTHLYPAGFAVNN